MPATSQTSKNIWSVILILIVAGLGIAYWQYQKETGDQSLEKSSKTPTSAFKKFGSETEFKQYLEERSSLDEFSVKRESITGALPTGDFSLGSPLEPSAPPAAPSRVSGTNIQVAGIDEPDILKTNGTEIFYSAESYFRFEPEPELVPLLDDLSPTILPPSPPPDGPETKIFKAFPPAELAKRAGIPMTGNLLLSKNILMIFGGDRVVGYDVSNPASPRESWRISFENNHYLNTARLTNGKLYLITSSEINRHRPCPIIPMKLGASSLEIPCTDIYYPTAELTIQTVYTAAIIDPANGASEGSITFVGSSESATIFMSANALYVTYAHTPNLLGFFTDFLKTKARDLAPSWLIEKLEKLASYDISQAAKMTEFETLMNQWINSLDEDESRRIENEFENRIKDYAEEHLREFEMTDIVKIALDDFDVRAVGKVPGYPLNQFSLDEFENHLRIATTVGNTEFSNSTENDVYVLDDSLEIVGSVKGMGQNERIYAVRFIGDKGYVVTFRETDPFYVLDLSNPKKPHESGELKIPGYSSYLHPITDDVILGVGKEDANVKLSLFDVSNPTKPIEVSKYRLDEYWSEILNTQYAFLLDTKHRVFFIPGSADGYIFSYEGNQLSLKRVVTGFTPRRALYLDDYLYLVSDSKIIVLNEADWVEVKTLEF